MAAVVTMLACLTGLLARMWIGYEDVDRLITYPDAHNLFGCS